MYPRKKVKKGSSALVPDAEDLLRKQKQKQRAQEETELRLRSQVLRRDLPRPFQVNGGFAKSLKEIDAMKGKESDLEIASELIKLEMVNMMTQDAIDYPTKNVRPPKKAGAFKYDKYTETELKNAQKLLNSEVAELSKSLGSFSLQDYALTWERCNEDLIYLPHVKKFTLMSLTKSESDKMRALQFQYDSVKADLEKYAKKCKSLVNPLQVYLGGYQKVATEKERAIHELHKQISEARVELSVFQTLRENELKAIPQRIELLKKEVETQRTEEAALQARFANLVRRKNELLQQQPQQEPEPVQEHSNQ